MWVLVDRDNEQWVGPFKKKSDGQRYARLNDWGPAEGDGSRFGSAGWDVVPLTKPDEATDESYRLVFD